MLDVRMTRIQKQLLSSIHMLEYATTEAEHLAKQDLSDDLHPHLKALRDIHSRIGRSGQAYKPL